MLKAIISTPGVTATAYVSINTINVPAQPNNYIVIVDNSAPTTVNLPANPANNQVVEVQDGGMNAGTFPITIQGNGHNLNSPNGVGTAYEIGQNGTSAHFTWQGILGTWGVE